MKNKNHLVSISLASIILILSLILFLSTASAASVQSASPAATDAYIPNSNGTVSVIDTAPNAVISTVNKGSGPEAFEKFIVSSSAQPAALLTANFTSNVTSGYAPLYVQFTNLSVNATGWNWSFGDGTNSTEQNPLHIYSTAGIVTPLYNATFIYLG